MIDEHNKRVLYQLDECLKSFECIDEDDYSLFDDSDNELEFCKVAVLHGESSRYVASHRIN